jgi:IrrE N-terminal-like domain
MEKITSQTIKQIAGRAQHRGTNCAVRQRPRMHRIDQPLRALHDFAWSRGTSVHYAVLPDGIRGCAEDGRIALRADLGPQQELLTLVHELTHIMAHVTTVRARTPRTVCEYEAEAVEQLIAGRLGISAVELESCMCEVPLFPDGLLADSVIRVRGVARTLIAVVSARQPLTRASF